MDVDFMKNLPIFLPLSEDETTTLLRICKQHVLRPGEVLVEQAATTRSLYILERGEVAVVYEDPLTGRHIELAILGEGAVIGEMALIDSAPRSASIIARTPTVVQELPAKQFHRLMAENDPAPYSLIRGINLVLCERLRRVNGNIAQVMRSPRSFLKQHGITDADELERRSRAFRESITIEG